MPSRTNPIIKLSSPSWGRYAPFGGHKFTITLTKKRTYENGRPKFGGLHYKHYFHIKLNPMKYNTKLFIQLTDKIDELLIVCKEDGFNGMHYWHREVDQYFDHGKKEAMSPQVFCQAFGEYLHEMFIEHELDVISGGCIYMNELLVIIANEGVHWRKIASKFLPYAAEKEYVFDYKPHANYVAW